MWNHHYHFDRSTTTFRHRQHVEPLQRVSGWCRRDLPVGAVEARRGSRRTGFWHLLLASTRPAEPCRAAPKVAERRRALSSCTRMPCISLFSSSLSRRFARRGCTPSIRPALNKCSEKCAEKCCDQCVVCERPCFLCTTCDCTVLQVRIGSWSAWTDDSKVRVAPNFEG